VPCIRRWPLHRPWCQQFLTGRRPQTTQVYNFEDSFRRTAAGEPGVGAAWVTLPGYFNRSGYYATSSGKVRTHTTPTLISNSSWGELFSVGHHVRTAVASRSPAQTHAVATGLAAWAGVSSQPPSKYGLPCVVVRSARYRGKMRVRRCSGKPSTPTRHPPNQHDVRV
jgi:hypothetical protein